MLHFLVSYNILKSAMTAIVDEGLFPGNYEDYLNDDVAKQRELDLLGKNALAMVLCLLHYINCS